MGKKLVFNTTDANTILDSDSVGAYLRASDGTLLTHTDVGGKKALDVRIAEGINVEVDLDYTDDSVTAHQGGTWVIDSITNAVTVSATDLDIRNLVFADDKVDVSGSSVSVTGDVNVTQGTSPWVVSATDLDIRDLSAASDSVESWLNDGTGNAITSTGGALDVNVTNSISINDVTLANSNVASAAVTAVGDVVASPLANRKYLFLANEGNRTAFLGPNGVTVGTGFPLYPGSSIEFRAGAAVDLEFAQAGGTIDVRSLELA